MTLKKLVHLAVDKEVESYSKIILKLEQVEFRRIQKYCMIACPSKKSDGHFFVGVGR